MNFSGKSPNDTTFSLGGIFGVAWFHTHPPIEFAPKGTSRRTGPSVPDLANPLPYKVPGIIYDYIGEKNTTGEYYIYNGHKKNEPAKIYFYGSERRPNQ